MVPKRLGLQAYKKPLLAATSELFPGYPAFSIVIASGDLLVLLSFLKTPIVQHWPGAWKLLTTSPTTAQYVHQSGSEDTSA